MVYRVDNARNVGTVEQPIKKHMAYSSLQRIRWDLTAIAVHKSVPSLSLPEKHLVTEELRVLTQYLKQKYELDSVMRKAVSIGRTETMIAVKHCLEDPNDFEAAIQEVVLLLVHWYIGARPGSILPTKVYNYYLPWKNILLRPIYVPGQGPDTGKMSLYGFFAVITLDTFKGFQYLQSLEISYPVRPTIQPKNLMLDLGNALMALAFRRNIVEGYASIEELRYDGPRVIRWKSNAVNDPVFLTRSKSFGFKCL